MKKGDTSRFVLAVVVLMMAMLFLEAVPGWALGFKPHIESGRWGARGFNITAIPHMKLTESLFVINLIHTFSWVSPLTAELARLGEVVMCFVLYRWTSSRAQKRDWWMIGGSVLLGASWLSQCVSFWLRGGVVDLLYWKPAATGLYAVFSVSDVGAYIGLGVLCAALVRYVIREKTRTSK